MVLSRTRAATAWICFLGTFAFLGVADAASGHAVSLWPSVLAIGLAFVTRHIYLSLFLGAWSGAILLRGGNPFSAFLALFRDHMLPSLSDPWNISVIVFTLLMGGLVEVLNAGGGMGALAAKLLGARPTRRRAGLSVWVMGWLLFIDGLANAMLVGKTMRAVTDRVGLSREKLAFMVDSTSSPIAGLALISTWVAYELSVIQQGLEQSDPARVEGLGSALTLLVQSLPYRFYNYFLLLLVFAVVWRGKDFGPMVRAEEESLARLGTHGAGRGGNSERRVDMRGASIWKALVPILILLAGVVGGLYVEGGGWERPWSWRGAMEAFGKANAALVFVWATAGASLAAILIHAWGGKGRGMGLGKSGSGSMPLESFLRGMNHLFLPSLILVLAWTLNDVLKGLGTAAFLVSWLEEGLPAAWLPGLVFLLAAGVSFCTGTSWGTMALVMPLTVPLAVALPAESGTGAGGPVLWASIGAVLAGAVFGDHCSPISDTTIVSSVSCECEVMEHVRTQMPYALLAAGAALLAGYGATGLGVPVAWSLAMGALLCWAALEYLGREPRHDTKR